MNKDQVIETTARMLNERATHWEATFPRMAALVYIAQHISLDKRDKSIIKEMIANADIKTENGWWLITAERARMLHTASKKLKSPQVSDIQFVINQLRLNEGLKLTGVSDIILAAIDFLEQYRDSL